MKLDWRTLSQKLSLTSAAAISVGIVVLLLFHIASVSLWQTLKRLEDLSLSQSRIVVLRGIDGMLSQFDRLTTAERWYLKTGDTSLEKVLLRTEERVKGNMEQLESNMPDKYRAPLAQLQQMIKDRFDQSSAIFHIRSREERQKELTRIENEAKHLMGRDPHKVHKADKLNFQEPDGGKPGDNAQKPNTFFEQGRFDPVPPIPGEKVEEHVVFVDPVSPISRRLEKLAEEVEYDYRKRDLILEQGALQTVAGIILLVAVMVVVLMLLLITVKKYVSERTQSRKILSEAESRFRAVFNQTFQFAGILSPDGIVVDTNQAALEFVGTSAKEVSGRYIWETPWWSHSTEAQSKLQEAIARAAGGETVRLEGEVEGQSRKAVVDFSVRPVVGEEGTVEYLVAESRDISDVVEATEALADREARMRTIVQTASDGIITFNSQGLIESVNPAMIDLTGFSESEMVGSAVDDFIEPSLSRLFDEASRARGGENKILGVGEDLFALTKEGLKVPIEVALGVIELEEGGSEILMTGIVRDITERMEAQTRLKEFYSTVSHELRTPLTAIRTALELLKNTTDTARIESVVDIATAESDRLIRMVNDILDIRRIEAGKLNLDIDEVPARQLIDRAIQAVESISREANIEIVARVESDAVCMADADRIHQVLTNLISNAIKFSPDSSTVQVLANSWTGRMRFEVKDEGPGVPEEEREKIFGRFEQLSTREERSKGGTGLGLAIAKGIVENHGGAIGVDVANGSSGSTFWFELPLA